MAESFHINLWLNNSIKMLEEYESNDDSRFDKVANFTLQKIAEILHEEPLEAFTDFSLLEEAIDVCLRNWPISLRRKKRKSLGNRLFLSYLYLRNIPNILLLLRILTFFNSFEINEKIALHYSAPVGDFVCYYLHNNTDYLSCLLFQVVNTWAKNIITKPDTSHVLVNCAMKLAINDECSFLRLFKMSIDNGSYPLPSIFNVLRILVEHKCLDQYLNCVLETEAEHFDSPFSMSFLNFIDYGSEMFNHFTYTSISNGERLLIHVYSYCRLLSSLSQDETGRQLLKCRSFNCYVLNSLNKLDQLLTNELLFSEKLYQETLSCFVELRILFPLF